MNLPIKGLIKEPHVDLFGKTVNPGDKVLILTTSWSRPSLDFGVYLGYVEKQGYRNVEKNVKVLVTYKVRKPFHKGTNEPAPWTTPYSDMYFKEEDAQRISTLKLNRIVLLEKA